MKLTVTTNNIDIHIARAVLSNQRFSPEAKILSEIMRLDKIKTIMPSIFLYNYLPEHLLISKDIYRRAIAKLKKQKFISKKGPNIVLCKNLKNLTQLTIK